MDWIIETLKQYGLLGLVCIVMGYIIWKYLLPTIITIGKTNAAQAESLVEVSHTLDKIHREISNKIDSAKSEIIAAVNNNKQKHKT